MNTTAPIRTGSATATIAINKTVPHMAGQRIFCYLDDNRRNAPEPTGELVAGGGRSCRVWVILRYMSLDALVEALGEARQLYGRAPAAPDRPTWPPALAGLRRWRPAPTPTFNTRPVLTGMHSLADGRTECIEFGEDIASGPDSVSA